MKLKEQSILAKKASYQIRISSLDTRNAILNDFAKKIKEACSQILEENKKDLLDAESNGMSRAMIDRLTLTEERIDQIAEGVYAIVKLEDPLNKVLEERTISQGVQLKKVSSAMGVIGVIFESRPNVSADCSALCIKAGSACILKGGKESYRTCRAIIEQMKKALKENGISEDGVMLAEKPSHEEVAEFMEDRDALDLLIPRGGRRLIQSVVNHAKVPVIETGAGVCHVYIENSADVSMAKAIVLNAKCQRPSVCNAMETLLVEREIAERSLQEILQPLLDQNVVIYADETAYHLVPGLQHAEVSSWETEYNDLVMNLKIVSSTEEAIEHIETYGTHHSEAIVSENPQEVCKFMNGIDSACVYHNASTRFTDGFEFGLGAEIGISTQKLHARGPMGLNELTTYTYHLEGSGQIRK